MHGPVVHASASNLSVVVVGLIVFLDFIGFVKKLFFFCLRSGTELLFYIASHLVLVVLLVWAP